MEKVNDLLTSMGNPSTGGDNPRISKENYLQQYARVMGRCTGFFVLITVLKDRKIKLMVMEIVQGVLKGTGKDLFLEKNRYKFTFSYRLNGKAQRRQWRAAE